MSTEKSRMLFERADKVAPGGIHSNIRFHPPYPLYFSKAKGAYVWDVDGNMYVDCVALYGATILGHGHPKVLEAVKEWIESGLTCGMESELSVEVAEKLCKMIPCAETVKFSNSGTEAVMKAIMIARGYTGKQKIIKIEGGYNGWYDSVMVSHRPPLSKAGPPDSPNPVPDHEGMLFEAAKYTVVIPYNDVEAAEKAVKKHRGEVAALIVEPVAYNLGCVLPKEGYLKALREITEENDVLLIFDEVITGFRLAPGGAQEYYKVTPDIATFAKAIANGFPLSAVAAKREIMEVTRPGGKVMYGGVYNGSHCSLAAASATLDLLMSGEVQRELHEKTNRLVKEFNKLAEEIGVAARMQGIAGQFQVYFIDREVVDYRTAAQADAEKFKVFQSKLFENKIYSLPQPLFHHGLTIAHGDKEIELILEAMRDGLEEVKRRC